MVHGPKILPTRLNLFLKNAHFQPESIEFRRSFSGKHANIEPGEILTLEDAEIIDGQIKVVDKFNNTFSISSAFYRYVSIMSAYNSYRLLW